VTVTELAVDAAGWQQLADHVVRLANVTAAGVLELLELGPDVSTEQAGVYLATETATGGSLGEPVGDPDHAARLEAVVVAARAAHAMHEAGLPHGSISPARVLFTGHGPVLGPPRLDAPLGVAATFSHWTELVAVDPDVLAGEHPSRSSDIWALGAVLHSALSRRPLYPGIESDEPVTAVQRVLFTRPEIDPALAPGTADIVKACLERDPASRPETALEVAERLVGVAA
jgi:serine/threonine protein kinase